MFMVFVLPLKYPPEILKCSFLSQERDLMGSNAPTCNDQNDCISFSARRVERAPDCDVGSYGCVFKVCIHFDFDGGEACGEDKNQFSHVCSNPGNGGSCALAPSDTCGASPGAQQNVKWDIIREDGSADGGEVGPDDEMCQYVKNGDTAYFNIKDANQGGCEDLPGDATIKYHQNSQVDPTVNCVKSLKCGDSGVMVSCMALTYPQQLE